MGSAFEAAMCAGEVSRTPGMQQRVEISVRKHSVKRCDCLQVKSTLIAAATKGTLELSSARPGTPNRLLYSWIGGNDIVSASMGPPAPRNISCC